MWAVIGGTGFEKFSEVKPMRALDRTTPFGEASSGMKLVEVQGQEVIFLSRHGEHHETNPSEVNYRANIFALKKHGATKVISFSAVGSLQQECAPGDLVVPSQYVDRTKGLRVSSFSGAGLVAHVALAQPIWKEAAEWLQGRAKQFPFKMHFNKTALVVEGPYFSTKAESHLHRGWGCDIIGMTAFPEFALAREAGLAFLPCSFVTDYDSWNPDEHEVTLEIVTKILRENNAKGFQVLLDVLKSGLEPSDWYRNAGLRSGIMTPKDKIPAATAKWLETLLA